MDHSNELNMERLLKDECEELYFGFSSTVWYGNFECWLQGNLKNVLKELEDNIIDMYAFTEEEKITLHNQIGDIYKTYIQDAEEPLRKIKAEIEKLLSIPPNVVIPGTEIQNKHKNKIYTDNDITKMKDEILCLQDRIIKEHIFLAKLKQVKNLIDKLQPKFKLLNATISASKSLLSSVSERVIKIHDMHDKSVKLYLDKTGDNLRDLHMEKKVFFE